MKLTYRDKMLLIIILLAAVWAIGIVFFIKPKIQDVGKAKTELADIKVQYAKVEEELTAAETIKTQCNNLLKQAQEDAEKFYNVLKSYEAEEILTNLLQNKSNPIEISDLSITGPIAASLSNYKLNENSLSIPIIDSADIGTVQETDKKPGVIIKEDAETVGCYNYTITFKAKLEDIKNFVDKIPTSNNKSSLVVTNLSINDYTQDVIEGTMNLSLYFVKTLEGENVDEILEANAAEKEAS